MKALIFAFLLLIYSLPTFAQQQNHKNDQPTESTLPPVPVWDLLRSNLSIARKFDDLPRNVQMALASGFQQHANPRCADCKGRGLIFAGISSHDGCFVYYRAIGLATSYEIVVFDNKAQPIWAAHGVHARDLEELQSAIAAGKFYSFPVQELLRH